MQAPQSTRWEDARPLFLAYVARCARRQRQSGMLMLAGGVVVAVLGFLLLSGAGMALVKGAHDKSQGAFPRAWVPMLGWLLGFLGSVLLFATYTPTRIEELSEFRSPGEDSLWAAASHRTGKQNLGQLLLCWLYGGPALVRGGLAHLRGASGLRGEAAEACAAALYVLYEAGQRVAYTDLPTVLQGVQVQDVAARLRAVDGVIFLESAPPGMSLSTPLRDELACLTLGL